MKKRYTFLVALSLLPLGSCSQIGEYELHNNDSPGERVTVEATFGDIVETKTSFQGTDYKTIYWSPGDEINLFYGSMTRSRFTSTMTEPSASASFTGTLGAATGSSEQGVTTQTFWGIYPYDDENTCDGEGVTLKIKDVQTSSPNSFGKGMNPSVANSQGLSLSFYNVGSWFVFSVTESGVTSVKLSGNNDEDIAGKVYVTMDSSGKPVSQVVEGEGLKSIIVTPEEGNAFIPNTEYCITVIPQTLTNGFTFTMYKDDQLAVRKTNKPIIFDRNANARRLELDDGLTWQSLWVDMGDGLEWAVMNVGASYPEDYGNLYAWGETVPIAEVYASDPGHEFNSSFVDVATEAFGEGCRMPTLAEWQTLLDETKFEWTWDSQKKGYTVRSLNNNNIIFLPAAGSYGEPEVGYVEVGETGNYWSSTKNLESSVNYLFFYEGNKCTSNCGRSAGCSVRAVRAVSASVPEYVDMGNGMNWATMNLGASSPEEIGDYFAWGETTPKSSYTQDNYNVTEFQDAAAANLGSGWRMPSKDEWAFLVNSCDWEWTAVNGVNGYMVTSSDTGNSIFLPASGRMENSSQIDSDQGWYWTLTKYPTDNISAYELFFMSGGYRDANNTSAYYYGLPIRPVYDPQPLIDDHEYVDMGDGMLWATCNVGADSPEDYGDYFAWGETEPKDDYSWSEYKYGTSGNLTKYNGSDGKTILEAGDDAATANWGDGWRTPTDAEWTWLRDNCTWEWTTVNGVYGQKVTSNTTGNTIFLPAAGTRCGTSLLNAGSYGYYWSSSLYEGYSYRARRVFFHSGEVGRNDRDRYYGLSVRPVYMPRIAVEGLSLDMQSVSLSEGESAQLSAIITPVNATEQGVIWSSSDESVVTVDFLGEINVVGEGYATITATTVDGSNLSASCTVTVESKYVEMAPGYYWAKMNVGAESASEPGDLFAWAESTPKTEFTWSNYTYGTGESALTKYVWDSSYGTVDSKRVLDDADDAVKVNWGDGGRIPTASEWQWLLDNCTWKLVSNNGVRGYNVTSKVEGYTDNSIFIPTTYSSTGPNGSSARYGYYWSSTLFRSSTVESGINSSQAIGIYVSSYNGGEYGFDTLDGYRFRGRSVRAVKGTLPNIRGHAYVDMGNGLKWATTNLGASTAEGYGDYFAWGETEPYYESGDAQSSSPTWKSGKESGYAWASYTNYTTDGGSTFTKYNGTDGSLVLDMYDDAASASEDWGGTWRIPTDAEWTWLRTNCTWTWTDNYNGSGIAGRIVTSNVEGYVGNTIFLPAAGRRYGTSLVTDGSYGYYWSSSLNEYYSDSARGVYFYSGGVLRSGSSRYVGFSVRPVSE